MKHIASFTVTLFAAVIAAGCAGAPSESDEVVAATEDALTQTHELRAVQGRNAAGTWIRDYNVLSLPASSDGRLDISWRSTSGSDCGVLYACPLHIPGTPQTNRTPIGDGQTLRGVTGVGQILVRNDVLNKSYKSCTGAMGFATVTQRDATPTPAPKPAPPSPKPPTPTCGCRR